MFLHVSVILSTEGGLPSLGRHPHRQTTRPPKMDTAADGTYSTGMHSCLAKFFQEKCNFHALFAKIDQILHSTGVDGSRRKISESTHEVQT